jgi:pimeloyl-ACP methyl ester carboxylesterase
MTPHADSQDWSREARRVLISPIANDALCWRFSEIDGEPFEYPGHGSRDRQPGWTHETFAKEVVENFDGPLDLVGISMGGTVVANILVRYPERIRSAIIICSGSMAYAEGTPEQIAQRVARFNIRGRTALKGGMEAVVDDMLSQWFSPATIRADAPGVQYARKTLLGMDPEAWNDAWMCQAHSPRLKLDALTAIQQPVTIVGGSIDKVSGLRGPQLLHSLIANSRYEIWPTSHFIHLEQPEFIRAIVDRHSIWAPSGKRIEEPLGSAVWFDTADQMIGRDG